MLEQRILDGEQKKWMAKLMGYDFEIHYKEGKENRVADALSRVVTTQAISMVCNEELNTVAEEIGQDQQLQKIIQELICHPQSHPLYVLAKRCFRVCGKKESWFYM